MRGTNDVRTWPGAEVRARYGRGMAPVRTAAWLAWVETAVLTLSVPMLGRWLRPEDPFLLGGTFSWSCLAVLLVALRYGSVHGLACASALGLGVAAAWYAGLLPAAAFPLESCFGLLVVGGVCGEFRDVWARRVARAERWSEELRAQLERFSRVFHLLRASHDRLEQRLVGGAPSLREVLTTLRKRLVLPPPGESPLKALGEVLLGMMASHGGVQAAALHGVEEGGRLREEPVAVLGACRASGEEPLVREALRRGQMMSVSSFAGAEDGTALLAALPLVGVDGRVWGLVAISEMQFISFNDDTLRLLSVLGAHVGDVISQVRLAERSGDAFLEVERRLLAARRDGQHAGVVALWLEGTRDLGWLEVLAERCRVLDAVWRVPRADGTSQALFLLPLTDGEGIGRFLARCEEVLAPWLREASPPCRLLTRAWSFQPGDRVEELLTQLRRTCETDAMEGVVAPVPGTGAAERELSLVG